MWHAFDRTHIDRRHVVHGYEKPAAEIARTLAEQVENGTICYP